MSGVAHFFVVVGGSKIHERMAHFFIDIYTSQNKTRQEPFWLLPLTLVSSQHQLPMDVIESYSIFFANKCVYDSA